MLVKMQTTTPNAEHVPEAVSEEKIGQQRCHEIPAK
jgi:hypothetical protein